MKKKIAILLITAMLTGMVTACGGNTDRSSDEVQTQTQDAEAMVHLENAEEVSAFFDEMYANIPTDQIPSAITTTELDLQDADVVSYNTGLTDVSQIAGISISESMIGSVAYSVVYIRTQEGADVEQIRQNLMDNVNPAKWICVTAEKQIAGRFGDDIFFVMAAADTADLVYGEALKVAESRNMTVAEPLEMTNPM
ncbi:MAG: hypothetical protein MR531_00235 [Lachnospiraceae bacterium]|nr:hypothetical protein [Lachnospiraceae bacterium]